MSFKKKDLGIIRKNIFNGSNLINSKSNSANKSKNNSNLKKSDNNNTVKNLIEEIHEEINEKNDINPRFPMSPQIGLNRNKYVYIFF
jgi:hypothetical protein